VSERKKSLVIPNGPSAEAPWVVWAMLPLREETMHLMNPCGCATEEDAAERLRELIAAYGGCGAYFRMDPSSIVEMHVDTCDEAEGWDPKLVVSHAGEGYVVGHGPRGRQRLSTRPPRRRGPRK